jgi:transcriptional regulator with XRE-family HTH domain
MYARFEMAQSIPSSEIPGSVTEAVRKLRKALGETQQQFAYRMNTAVRTIARYETVRPPQGRVLRQLEEIAMEHDLGHIAEVFHGVLEQEFGLGSSEKTRYYGVAVFGRNQLLDVFDEYVRLANQDGRTVTEVRLEFDRSDGRTYVADIAPPEIQRITRGDGKKITKTVPRKEEPPSVGILEIRLRDPRVRKTRKCL